MMDSINWQLNKDQFKLLRVNKFDGVKTQKIIGFSGRTIFCKRYADQLKKKGIYFPMLDITTARRGLKECPEILNIQISLGKALYGSNAFETNEENINQIYQRTVHLLKIAEIETSINELRQAIVRKADFSKMITLPTYLGRANEVILKLLGFNYKPCSEFNFFNYQEGLGNLIRFGNTTQKYTIYDKVGEIFSKGYTKIEKAIIKSVRLGEMERNALKFELSYNRKDSFEKAMRARFEGNKKKDFCLEDIFKLELSKDILLKAFDSVFEGIAVGLISLSEMEENKLWAYLENSGLSQKRQQDLFYWVRMATKNGIAGTWAELKRKYKGGSIVRKKKEIALILQELGTISGNTPNLIDFLRAEHDKFKIIKPKSLVNYCKVSYN
ncbi:MAG: hypothetical protein PHI88_01195 [Candidatus Pacebacteria bacterium]|nr:hypothetical protein [Candidatus Paceibacterota bacterium]